MPSLPTYSQAYRCLACLSKSFLREGASIFSHPSRVQWRGKKKLSKRTTINVRLLKDIDGYGREGFIIPVAPARMRNNWFPKGRAQYVTAAEMRSQKAFVMDRDHNFKLSEKKEGDKTGPRDLISDVNVTLLSPSRTLDILQRLVPDVIEFRRQPIQMTPVISEGLAQPEAPDVAIPANAIYGSVTMGDVAANVRALLALQSAHEPDAARVVILPEDVKIVASIGRSRVGGLSADEEAGRIKNLGEWTLAIQVKGGDQVIKRLIVLPEAPQIDVGIDPAGTT